MQISGHERSMGIDEIIVSKTNSKGHLTYVNDVFLNISDFTIDDLLGHPHAIVRNDAMPRCIFKLLWETIQSGQEIFAYVVNKTKFGEHYWVFAHVTPSHDEQGNITGYHSNRRKPSAAAVAAIGQLYEKLLQAEQAPKSRKTGLQEGYDLLMTILKERGQSYDEFVLSL